MSSITTNTRSVNFNYPLVTSKTSIGNDVDLALTKWRIEVTAKDLEKKNITINDTMTLGSEFGSYLSISNMVIKKVIGGQ